MGNRFRLILNSYVAYALYLFIILYIIIEIYLRCSAAYVTRQKITSLGGVLEFGSDLLLVQGGLLPNTDVVIRNHYISKDDILVNINSLGFRDDEISEVKKKNELRILVLGDSITLADYLPAEDVYVEVIEKELETSFKDRVINVINAGSGDIGLREQINILTKQGLAIEPDIVIVGFYLNDSRPPWGFNAEYSKPSWLLRHSLLARALMVNIELKNWIKAKGKRRFEWLSKVDILDWANDKNAFLQLASEAAFDWGAAWDTDTWPIIDRNFKRLKILSKRYNFKVAVVVFPTSFQVYSEFLEDMPQQILQDKTSILGFYYFDLLPIFRDNRNKNLYFDHCHPTKDANAIAGKAIASFIKGAI